MPRTLIDALARMIAENEPGVALRLSTGKNRHNPGHELAYLLSQDKPDYREMFAETIFVCLESPVIQDCLRGADPGHTLVLFDGAGRVESGTRFNFADNFENFATVATSLVHGPNNSRLKERAATIRKKTEPDVIESLDRLGAAGSDIEADASVLLWEASGIVPLLVHARLETTLKARQEGLRNVIDQYFQYSTATKLPFGVEMGLGRDGCGDSCAEDRDTTNIVACGMALPNPNARSFIRYLTK
jgi:hypothetical protein